MGIDVSNRILSTLGSAYSSGPVRPVSPSPDASAGPSAGFPFGPAVIREQRRAANDSPPVYGQDARLKGESGAVSLPGASDEEKAADAQRISKLQQRDQAVRQREESKGEAVNGENFIYQTGPDGKRYAVGTAVHLVKPEGENGSGEPSSALNSATPDSALMDTDLSASDQELIQRLRSRDLKVRAHEAAHVMAGGSQIQGPVNYVYQTGPDGQRYAVGGSVNIAVSSVPGDPEATARNAKQAQQAAMAAGEMSARDAIAADKAADIAARAKEDMAPWKKERAFAAYAAAQGL